MLAKKNNTSNSVPVITLKGKTADTISLNQTYIDPGTTGTDTKDGDITPFIVVSGSVNTNITGNYSLTYNLRNGSGNYATPVTRNVAVINQANNISGNYFVSGTTFTLNGYSVTNSNPFSYITSVSTSTISNGTFTISNYSDTQKSIEAHFSQASNNTFTFYGSYGNTGFGNGTVLSDKKSFKIIQVGTIPFSKYNLRDSTICTYTRQ